MRHFFACLLALSLVAASWAADKSEPGQAQPARFSAGDTVRVMWDGQQLTGTVVEQTRSGWFKVKLNSHGTELSPVFAEDRLQLIKRVPSESPANEAASRTAQRTEQTAKVSPTDWSVVNNVFVEEAATWSLKADPVPTLAGQETLKPRAILLRHTGQSRRNVPLGTESKLGSLLFASASRLAFVVTSDASSGAIPQIRLQRVDLVKGEATEPVALPTPMWPVDVDPTGTRILVASDSQIGVWEFDGRTLLMIRAWIPGLAAHAGVPPQPGERPRRRSRSPGMAALFARFIDANHVLTTASSQLVMWEVSASRALYKIPVRMAAVTLSPGRKSFVASLEDGLYAFDALTGKTEGKLQGDTLRASCLAFDPGGHRLAGLDRGRLSVWNLDTGRQEREINPTAAFPSRNNIEWVFDNDVLVGGRDLVDLNRGIVLWQYRLADAPPPEVKSYGQLAGSFWYVTTSRERDTRGLFAVVLPHAAARSRAAALDSEQSQVVKAAKVIGVSELTATGIEDVPDDPRKTPRTEPQRSK